MDAMTALLREKQRLAVTLRAIGDGVLTVDPDGRVEFLNAAAERMLRVRAEDVAGCALGDVVDVRDDRDERRQVPLSSQDERGEVLLGLSEPRLRVAFVSSPIVSEGTPLGHVIVLRDVTAQYRLTRRLAYEAMHDPLTRLPNRRRFEDEVAVALETARNTGLTHALAFIDLDRFKSVNDRLGHLAGDAFLRDIARRMAANVRGNDIIARLGGDEFGVLLHECTVENGRRAANKIRAAVAEASRELGHPEISVGASIGLAPIDATSESVEAMVAAADAACYAAKAAGRNTVVTRP